MITQTVAEIKKDLVGTKDALANLKKALSPVLLDSNPSVREEIGRPGSDEVSPLNDQLLDIQISIDELCGAINEIKDCLDLGVVETSPGSPMRYKEPPMRYKEDA